MSSQENLDIDYDTIARYGCFCCNQSDSCILQDNIRSHLQCIGDKDNDYCGKISFDEFLKMIVNCLQEEKQNLLGTSNESNCLTDIEYFHSKAVQCALKLAKEYDIRIY